MAVVEAGMLVGVKVEGKAVEAMMTWVEVVRGG